MVIKSFSNNWCRKWWIFSHHLSRTEIWQILLISPRTERKFKQWWMNYQIKTFLWSIYILLIYISFLWYFKCYILVNRIGGVMVSVLVSSAVDRGFEPRSGQSKDYYIAICCLSAKHAALRRKSKDWLARNQDNVFEWDNMSIRGLSFQWASTIKI